MHEPRYFQSNVLGSVPWALIHHFVRHKKRLPPRYQGFRARGPCRRGRRGLGDRGLAPGETSSEARRQGTRVRQGAGAGAGAEIRK